MDYEHEALNALSLSEECIKSTVGSMQLNALYAQAYATQAVALSNLALLHKGDGEPVQTFAYHFLCWLHEIGAPCP